RRAARCAVHPGDLTRHTDPRARPPRTRGRFCARCARRPFCGTLRVVSASHHPRSGLLYAGAWPFAHVLFALFLATGASPPEPAAPVTGGYWLGAQQLGPGSGVLAATEVLSLGTSVDGAPTDADAVVGQAASVHEALQFVARWAFTEVAGPALALPLHLGPAPVPGGDLLATHGVAL